MPSEIEKQIFDIWSDTFEEYILTFEDEHVEPTSARCWSKDLACIKGLFWSIPALIPSHDQDPYKVTAHIGPAPAWYDDSRRTELFAVTRGEAPFLCVISDRGKPGSHRAAYMSIVNYDDEFVQDVLFNGSPTVLDRMAIRRKSRWDLTSAAVAVDSQCCQTTVLVFPEELVYQYTNPWR